MVPDHARPSLCRAVQESDCVVLFEAGIRVPGPKAVNIDVDQNSRDVNVIGIFWNEQRQAVSLQPLKSPALVMMRIHQPYSYWRLKLENGYATALLNYSSDLKPNFRNWLSVDCSALARTVPKLGIFQLKNSSGTLSRGAQADKGRLRHPRKLKGGVYCQLINRDENAQLSTEHHRPPEPRGGCARPRPVTPKMEERSHAR